MQATKVSKPFFYKSIIHQTGAIIAFLCFFTSGSGAAGICEGSRGERSHWLCDCPKGRSESTSREEFSTLMHGWMIGAIRRGPLD